MKHNDNSHIYIELGFSNTSNMIECSNISFDLREFLTGMIITAYSGLDLLLLSYHTNQLNQDNNEEFYMITHIVFTNLLFPHLFFN